MESLASSRSVLVPGARHRPTGPERTYRNPVLAVEGVDHGDPFVLEYCGEYVLYHCGTDGIMAHRSRDLVRWEPVGRVLTPRGSAWAEAGFRAPVVVREGCGFVMYVSATGYDGDDDRRRQGVARSASATGPFVLDPAPLRDEWAIDGYPFTEDDGSRWLFHTVRTENSRTEDSRAADGTGGVLATGNVVQRLGADGGLVGTPEPVCSPSERWEGDETGERYRNDGPVVLRRGGWYHQLYAGGFAGGPGCGTGLARAPALRGPWTKDVRNPVFVSGRRITGPGRHTVVVGPDGATPYAVYHGYDGDRPGRAVHVDRLRWAGDGPRTGDCLTLPGRPGEGRLPVPAPPVCDPAVPHQHIRAWVEGGVAHLFGIEVPLPRRMALLTAGTDGMTAVIRLDGVVVARPGTADVAEPLVVVGGCVHHSVTTSRLDDERRYVLRGGSSRAWSWGGLLPVCAEVAVRGRATLQLGSVEQHIDTVDLNGGNGFAVVVLEAHDGAARLLITADTDTEVVDVVLAARPCADR